MHPGPLLPGMEADPDAETMRPRDASELIRHGAPDAVLRFWTSMGLSISSIERDMAAYNAGIAKDLLIIPFATTEDFLADPGVRAGIAGIYNAKQGGRSASYAEAAATAVLVPRRPRKRSLVDAFRERLARDAERATGSA